MRKLTTEEFIEKAKHVHGDRYDYSEVCYTTAKRKVNIICREHGVFQVEAFSHLSGTNCPACVGGPIKDTKEFIRRAVKTHGDKYEYNQDFLHCKKEILINCRTHGEFLQKPDYHIQGNGCPRCAGRGLTMQMFLDQAISIHGDRYDYSKVFLKGSTKPVEIVCKVHGSFWQQPFLHTTKLFGCPACGIISQTHKRSKTPNNFLSDARHIHGERYDYSMVNYIRTESYIDIICPIHGCFKQTPASHLMGRGCKKCSHRVSKGETEWLDFIGITRRQVRIVLDDRLYEFDGYDEHTRTVYEYYGDYWHGNPHRYNPSTINPQAKLPYGELYERTMARRNRLEQLGYTVISIWEAEWTGWKPKMTMQKP